MDEEKIEMPKLDGHHCFACGTENPKGLNLNFYRQGDFTCADFTPDKLYEGWDNVVHGGILSTLLDEVMSWTIIYAKKTFMVTRSMTVKYIRPVEVGTPLIVKGRIIDDSKAPKVTVMAEIRDMEDRLLTKGQGSFIMLSREDMSSVPEKSKKEMIDVFDRIPG
ncbi:MAG: PaaI family thioesterase [Deltaproteobacteria bacterium]|nr:PaaI family thioesterase [Deltaproteobacteria bacterium]